MQYKVLEKSRNVDIGDILNIAAAQLNFVQWDDLSL